MEENAIINNENLVMNDSDKKKSFLTTSVKMEFLSSAKWGKYLAITGIASSVLVFIMGVNMLFMAGIEDSEEMLDSTLQGVTIFTAVFMWIIAGLGFALSFLLFRGCNKILFSLNNNMEEESLISGMHKVRLFTQIVAILSMISVFFSLISTFCMIIVYVISK